MNLKLTTAILLLGALISCTNNSEQKQTASSSDAKFDRTILPIQPPEYEAITELDARNATAPEGFEITAPEGAPNIVIVLIDDIGFSATETFGGVISTPAFDLLANNGLRYTRFHTTALCSPTRAALLSGRNHHNVNVGSVAEVATAYPGNNGQRPDNAKYFAETLSQNGYNTAAFGKWHETAPWEVSVSGPFDRWPTNSGFDKFYGFIGGENNQWDPLIYDGLTKMEKKDNEDYHFTTDMTNEAINWIKFQQAMTPDKPFMVYYAPGAVHAPHHAPKEWIEKYKGKFDDGWDQLREETFARQKVLGIIPENTKLAPKGEGIKEWDELSPQEQELFCLQMETFAGFTEHTDNEVGRMVGAIEEIGELDNTLFIYIMGDNGSSAEGGMNGTYNELLSLNGIFGVETVENMLEKKDTWGGPESFPHMAAGWAVATDVPFSWTKQIAGDFGGTRNSMVMHWPNGFKAKGEMRSQWHHVNDIGATVLEAAKLPEAKSIDGVEQKPFDGVSMLYTTDDKDAADRHKTQYFEILGNRGIYSEGWLARVLHRRPWESVPINTLQEDVWELYNINDDYSLVNNLADQEPEKLAQLIELFNTEGVKNNVFPIDDRAFERFDAVTAGRPDLMGGRTTLTLGEGMKGIMENAFINIKNTSKTLTADLELTGNDHGIILCQGGRFGGWALYLDEGKPTYSYNWFGLETYTVQSSSKLKKGSSQVKLVFEYDGDGMGKGGNATLYVDGKNVAEGRIENTHPALFSGDETADVGIDEATQVATSVFADMEESEFTGHIKKVEITIPEK
ncbi:MAG: arylsulfatase [Bacteroides sp.]|nr:arylsulfatase [Bacteroides sp.]